MLLLMVFFAFVTSPLLLPQILTGVALLQLHTLLKMQASYGALRIGHIVVTTPYVIRTVAATLTHFDLALEEGAQSLGAHPVRAFFEITLGVIKPHRALHGARGAQGILMRPIR